MPAPNTRPENRLVANIDPGTAAIASSVIGGAMGSAGGGSAPQASPYEKSLANLAKPWEQLAQGKGILAPAYQQVMNSFPSYGSVMADITESYRKAQQAAEGQSLIGNTLGRQQFATDPRYASETAKGLANMQMTLPSQLAIQKATTQQALLNPQAAGQLLSQAGQMWGQRQQMGQANQQNMQGLIGQAAGAYAQMANLPKQVQTNPVPFNPAPFWNQQQSYAPLASVGTPTLQMGSAYNDFMNRKF